MESREWKVPETPTSLTGGEGWHYVFRHPRSKVLNKVAIAPGIDLRGDGGIWIDRRKPEAELYIADRGNRRLQVYDLEVKFKRAFGSEFLTSPSAFAAAGDLLIVAELRARLVLLDLSDNLIGYLGDNNSVAEVEGWPNVPSHLVEPGKFNSPRGIAADEQGNIYVAEWLIGGRFTKLVKSY